MKTSTKEMFVGWLVALLLTAILAVVIGFSPMAKSAKLPSLIVLENESTVHEPGSVVVTHPADSTVSVCSQDGLAFEYHPISRTMLVPRPCNELFTDGFEE